MKAWAEVPFQPALPQNRLQEALRTAAPPRANGKPASGQATVFVALPTYNGWLKAQALTGLMLASQQHRVHFQPGYGSLLAMNFNGLWCKALNTRGEAVWTDWAMCHADVAPAPGWLDTLLEERRRVGADVLSCCVAIKDDRRLTSTGVIQADGSIRRLTIKEIYRLPETFSAADLPAIGAEGPLVVNTGLWVCDFSQPWVEEVAFNIGDSIRREPDGSFRPLICPEDWKFSDWCNKRGLKVFATRKIKPLHFGEGVYGMDPSEAGWETDLGDGPQGGAK